MANLFDVFTVSFGKAKDDKIAELEAVNASNLLVLDQERERADGLSLRVNTLETESVKLMAENDEIRTRNNALEAELSPFREYVAANAAETEAQADGAASPPAQVAKPKK